jgi:23S rRNA pseudouridine1911/1915/1917 synthase
VERGTRRLGRAAQQLLASSYSHAKREVLLGHVLVNGAVVADPGAIVREGDAVEHNPNLPKRARVSKTPPIEIVHLDNDVLVVNKPAGLLVHPTAEGEQDTVLSRAAAELERRTGRHRRVLVVHRLDRDTSGVLVLALSHAAAKHLQGQFRGHTVERRYVALVRGSFVGEVLVARGIGRPRPGARRAALAPGTGGRPAHTVVRPLETLAGVSLVEAELGTGRTHQVRVHLSYLGHPVLGDAVYGEPATDPVSPGRLALHAAVLGFVHPTTGERLLFRREPPQDFTRALALLRRRRLPQEAPAAAVPSRQDRRRSAKASPPPRLRTPRRRGAGGEPRPAGKRSRPRPARSHRRT